MTMQRQGSITVMSVMPPCTMSTKGKVKAMDAVSKRYCRWLFCTSLVCFFSCFSIGSVAVQANTRCQDDARTEAIKARLKAEADVQLRIAFAWTSQAWTGDDQPYQRIRSEIDQAIAQKKNPDRLMQQYGLLAQKNPADPQAQFRWGCAAFAAAMQPSVSDIEGTGKLIGPRSALDHAPSPKTYEYNRLRYLMAAYSSPVPHLKALGDRLLRRDPTDDVVLFFQGGILNYSQLPADRQRARAYAENYLRRFPKKPGPYSLLASIHYRDAFLNHSSIDADKAITAYRRYLELEPSNSGTRGEVDYLIQNLQRHKAEWGKGP